MIVLFCWPQSVPASAMRIRTPRGTTQRAAGSEVCGTVAVNCLQEEVAILSSLVNCMLLKVIGWLGDMHAFFPETLAISWKGRPVSCVRSQGSTPLTQLCLLISAINSVIWGRFTLTSARDFLRVFNLGN